MKEECGCEGIGYAFAWGMLFGAVLMLACLALVIVCDASVRAQFYEDVRKFWRRD